jgi:hypothetical protein
MAVTVVNLTDTFDEWRIKTNTLGTNTGDLTTLSTTAKNTLVAAINEIYTNDSDDMENVVDDTTPQLGGNLDLNGSSITGTGHIGITGSLTATSIAGPTIIASAVTGYTQSPSDNSTKLATTAYVDAQVATEDTLAEMNDTTMSGLANLDLLVYNSGTSVWENKTTAAAGIPTKGFTVAMAVALG